MSTETDLGAVSSGAGGSLAIHGEGLGPLRSSQLVLCALSSGSTGLILDMKKDVENEPFNLLMHFSFCWLSSSVFEPLACSALTGRSWE